MRPIQIQAILFFLFIGFLSLSAGCVITSFAKGEIYAEEMKDALVAVITAYSTNISVILGGLFAARSSSPRRAGSKWDSMSIAFRAALAASLLWNILISWRLVVFVVKSDDSIVAVLDYLADVSPASTFLVAGVLTFFFVQEGQARSA